MENDSESDNDLDALRRRAEPGRARRTRAGERRYARGGVAGGRRPVPPHRASQRESQSPSSG